VIFRNYSFIKLRVVSLEKLLKEIDRIRNRMLSTKMEDEMPTEAYVSLDTTYARCFRPLLPSGTRTYNCKNGTCMCACVKLDVSLRSRNNWRTNSLLRPKFFTCRELKFSSMLNAVFLHPQSICAQLNEFYAPMLEISLKRISKVRQRFQEKGSLRQSLRAGVQQRAGSQGVAG
jgi:hypothetical protein